MKTNTSIPLGGIVLMNLNANAVEEVLYSIKDPWIIHLATHGFFLSDVEIMNIVVERKSEEISRIRIMNNVRSSKF